MLDPLTPSGNHEVLLTENHFRFEERQVIDVKWVLALPVHASGMSSTSMESWLTWKRRGCQRSATS